MRFFKKKSLADQLASVKSRKEIIVHLENMGYFVRPKRVRKPKVGETIKFRSGAGWGLNTFSYCTATVIEWEDTPNPRGQLMKETGYVRARKISKNGKILIDTMVHPYLIVRVTKPRKPKVETHKLVEKK